MGAQTQLENKSGRSMEIQNEEQVFQKEAEAKRLSDQMVALGKWYRDDTEKTRQTFGGTTSGLVAEVNRKTREYESQRADLAIQANLAQDNYESAYRIRRRLRVSSSPFSNHLTMDLSSTTCSQTI